MHPPAAHTPDQPDPPGRWRELVVLASSMVLAMTTWFSASAVLPQLRVEWTLSSSMASWLTIAVQLGFVAGAVASAATNLADIVSPRRLMLVGASGAAVANLGLLAAGSGPPALVARAATGAALALVYPPGLKAMATWFRAGRGTALGVMVGALTLGSAAPHLVNGLGGARWRVVIVVTSALTLAGGLLADRVGRDGPFPFARGVFDPRQIGSILASRPVRLASLGYFGHMWELYAMWAWITAFAADELVHTARSASFIGFAVIGIGALGCAGGGVLADRIGRTTVTSWAMAISGSCAIAVGALRSGPLPLVVAVALVWGLTAVADSAQFSAIVTEVAESDRVGTALTVQLAVGFTLTVATIWLVPVLRDEAGWGWAFGVLAAGPALGIVAMQRLARLQAHPTGAPTGGDR